jgi:AraC family transcriptional regulator
LRREIEKRRQLAQRFTRLFEHIHRPGATKLSLAEAARMSAMSTAQFTRSFKQVAGMSYVACIIQTRLAHGVRLLRGGDHTIAEIASITGFADQSHFDRRFKAAFGVTPSQFQKRGNPPPRSDRSGD